MAANDQELVKRPHQTETYTNTQIIEFAKCGHPMTGPMYFMEHYFNIQHPVKGRIQYHPFEYQKKLLDVYHFNRFSVSLMPRQCGKCLKGDTSVINIRNAEGEIYDIPIGKLYEYEQAKQDGKQLPDISIYKRKML